jgi:hypothetical protein
MSARRLLVLAGSALVSACASSPRAMQRALDPSMERVLVMEQYLGTVVGVTRHPSRMMRSDGFVYVSDVSPVMRYFAALGDSAAYLPLRRFLETRLLFEDSAGLKLARRFREGDPPERATPYGYLWTGTALLEGWRTLRDTASARLLAQLDPASVGAAPGRGEMYRLSTDCGAALDAVATDAAPARAVLARARRFVRSAQAAREQAAMGVTASEGEVDLLSCLTRVGLALDDADAAVTYLDRMLDLLQPFLSHSGRTDVGTGADVLLTLHRVREQGPGWAAPNSRPGR